MSLNHEEITGNDSGFEFTSIADMLLTEIIIKHFQRDLKSMQVAIEEFKKTSQLFQGLNKCMYKQTKKNIKKYLNSTKPSEKECFRQRLVSLTNIYIYMLSIRLYKFVY